MTRSIPWASQVALVVKNPPANVGDARGTSSIPKWGRSFGVGNGNPLQHSCIPWTEEPDGQQSMEPQNVQLDWATEHRCILLLPVQWSCKQTIWKREYLEEDHKRSTSLHTVGNDNDNDSEPLSQWLTEITFPFPFKTSMAKFFRIGLRTWSLSSPSSLLTFWLKAALLSTTNCLSVLQYWLLSSKQL